MSRAIHCARCKRKAGEIAQGSKLLKGLVFLCPKCEAVREAGEMYFKNKGVTPGIDSTGGMDDIFKNFFNR